MKSLKWLSSLFVLLVFFFCLTGCFEGRITGAEPDPTEVIHMELGNTQMFSVDGSTPNGADGFYWNSFVKYYPVDDDFDNGKNLDFTVTAQNAWNKRKIACGLKFYYLSFGCNPYSGECDWFVTWAINYAWRWDIIVTQEPPVWHGGYIIENNSDAEKLGGFTEVTGDLWIKGNIFLTSLEPLTSLSLVGGNVYIGRNPSDQFVYNYNYALTTLDGLGSLTSIGGELNIDTNDALKNLGMDSLDYVGDDFGIDANPELCTYLAEGLRDQVLAGGGIGGWIDISGNKDCTGP